MRRFVVLLTTLATLFGALVATSGTAIATTPDVAPVVSQAQPNGDIKLLYNVVETYGWCYDTATSKPYWGTCTDGYDNTGWHYNCYRVDCGQIVVGAKGVSADKRKDFTFLGGYSYYQYINPGSAFSFNVGTSWTDRNKVVPFFQTGSFAGDPYSLQLISVTTYYYRDRFPLQTITPCDGNVTDTCIGGGMK